MSKWYRVLCLNHDPAIEIEHDWQDRAAVVEHARNLRYSTNEHRQCDLVIGCWSGGLIEIGCPGRDPRPGPWRCTHTDCAWTGMEWLRLLHAATAQQPATAALKCAINKIERRHTCWRPGRLTKLRDLLTPDHENAS